MSTADFVERAFAQISGSSCHRQTAFAHHVPIFWEQRLEGFRCMTAAPWGFVPAADWVSRPNLGGPCALA
jgi:hypothetical protein